MRFLGPFPATAVATFEQQALRRDLRLAANRARPVYFSRTGGRGCFRQEGKAMRLKTLALAVAISALAAAGLTFGVTEASASGPNVTYYACLNKGKLSLVGTTVPVCPSTASVISWNSQGT